MGTSDDSNSLTSSFNFSSNAVGEIFFPSTRKIAKYVRISDTISLIGLYEFVTKNWGIETPSMILSVAGGRENCKMHLGLSREFQRSLIKTANATGAWIVTDGLHHRIAKHVGDAIEKYHNPEIQESELVVIGVAPWNSVSDRERLVNDEQQKYKKVVYNKSLDPYHNHFILVDHKHKDLFQPVIKVRSNLKRSFAERQSKSTKVVSFLVGGDAVALGIVERALWFNTPVIVIEGSGEMADLLASLYKTNVPHVTKDLMSTLIKDHLLSDEVSAADTVQLTDLADLCMQQKELITIYKWDQTSEINSLNKCLFNTVLKTYPNDQHQAENNLRTAKNWNFGDVKGTSILEDLDQVNGQVLVGMLLEAIQQDKDQFVELVITYGLNKIYKYFTPEKWVELYRKTEKTGYVKKVESEADIVHLKQALINYNYDPTYQYKNDSPDAEENEYRAGQEVIRELFFYCIVYEKKKSALQLWYAMSDGSLTSAVVATTLIKSLSKIAPTQEQTIDLLSQSENYYKLSDGILTECYNLDKEKTTTLLSRRRKPWGGLTCLEISAEAQNIKFVAHPAVQHFLDNVWFKNIIMSKRYQPVFQLITERFTLYIAAFTLFLIPVLIKFDQSSSTTAPTTSKHKVPEDNSNERDSEFGTSETTSKQNEEKRNKYVDKIIIFYSSPVVKFYLTFVFYMLFLIHFAYILLFNFYSTINGYEIALAVWVVAGFLDQIRLFPSFQLTNCCNSFQQWWKQNGVKYETRNNIIAFVLYIIGFGLRFTIYLDTARVLLSFSFGFFTFRLLHIVTVSRRLGPQLLIFQQLVRELLFFALLLAIFLFSYGVVRQSILYPNEPNAGNVFIGILGKPFWSIFGSTFLPETAFNPTTHEFSCTNNRTLIDVGYRRCPAQNRVIPLVAASYMVIVNIILMAMLIALFSYTFGQTVVNSDSIWKHERYFLVQEYYHRSLLVVPFNVISQFVSFIACGRCDTEDEFAKEITSKESEDLNVWENKNKENYLAKVRAEKRKSDEINEKLNYVENALNNCELKWDKCENDFKKVGQIEKSVNESLHRIKFLLEH